jgi:hypothetical protein
MLTFQIRRQYFSNILCKRISDSLKYFGERISDRLSILVSG